MSCQNQLTVAFAGEVRETSPRGDHRRQSSMRVCSKAFGFVLAAAVVILIIVGVLVGVHHRGSPDTSKVDPAALVSNQPLLALPSESLP